MTNEGKQLLIEDLSARLPYGVKCHQLSVKEPKTIVGLIPNFELVFVDKRTILGPTKEGYNIELIKPYLRPMSSMTDEEKKEFIRYSEYEVEESVNGRHYEYYLKDYVGTPEKPICNYNAIVWLLKHHFDYRGLIKLGLALEVPEGMYN